MVAKINKKPAKAMRWIKGIPMFHLGLHQFSKKSNGVEHGVLVRDLKGETVFRPITSVIRKKDQVTFGKDVPHSGLHKTKILHEFKSPISCLRAWAKSLSKEEFNRLIR